MEKKLLIFPLLCSAPWWQKLHGFEPSNDFSFPLQILPFPFFFDVSFVPSERSVSKIKITIISS